MSGAGQTNRGAARPLVSVIVPAFNAEETLAETLGSALAQTWPNIEVIVVDDGSTDGTAEIAARCASADPRVRLLRKENGGVASARNAGIAEARGAFVAPLDADDIWHPTKLAKQMEVALGADRVPGFVYTLVRRIDGNGNILGSAPRQSLRGFIPHRHAHIRFPGAASSVLMPRATILEAGGYDERLRRGEDHQLQLKIASRHIVEVVSEYLVGYRLTPGALSADPADMIQSAKNVARLFREACPDLDHDAVESMLPKTFRETVRSHPLRALAQFRAQVGWYLYRRFRPRRRDTGPGPAFAEADVKAFISPDPVWDQRAFELVQRRDSWALARLAKLDRAYGERLRRTG